jgi:interleukin-1 receptor-associated kinase 1
MNFYVYVIFLIPLLSLLNQLFVGYGNAEPLPNRKHWFRWLVQWAQREPSTPQAIHDIIAHHQQSGSMLKHEALI